MIYDKWSEIIDTNRFPWGYDWQWNFQLWRVRTEKKQVKRKQTNRFNIGCHFIYNLYLDYYNSVIAMIIAIYYNPINLLWK